MSFSTTTTTTYTLSNSSLAPSSYEPEIKPIEKENDNFLPFHNSEIAKENFLSKLCPRLLDTHYQIHDKFNLQPLPRLEEKQLVALIDLLTEKRILKGRDNAFEISYTLAELFNFLCEKSADANIYVENIELVGSGVPYILNEYVYSVFNEMGFDISNDLLSQELLKQFARKPRDFDFRISVPQASLEEIFYLKGRVLEFFVEKKGPELDTPEKKSAYCSILLQKGFHTLTEPKPCNMVTAIGMMDTQSGCGIDIVIAKELKRKHLFIQDSLRLSIQQLAAALKIKSAQKLIELKAKAFDPIIIPSGDVGSGVLALIDRIAGIVRAIDIPSINCAGWGTLLICYLKGERCLDKADNLEKSLLDKLYHSFEKLPNEVDVPLALYQQLISIPNPTIPKKMATTVAFWLKKALASHLGNNQKAALILTLQACLSLKLHGYEEAIDELWLLMKHCAATKNPEICGLLNDVMNCGSPDSFKALISLLEVKSLLLMNTVDSSIKPILIMHNKKAAIQISIDGYYLLIPFECDRSLPNFIKTCQQIDRNKQVELLKTLDKLNSSLQPTSPYIAEKLVPERTLTLVDQSTHDFSTLWEKVFVEWILVCEVQTKTTAGSKFLEQLLPELLSQYGDKQQSLKLIQSAENKNNTPEEKKLYLSMKQLLSKNEFAGFPVRLLWAMALTSTGDPARCLEAFQLWNKHPLDNKITNKNLFTKLFIRKLSITRPDLAAEMLNGLPTDELSFEDATIVFVDIQKNFTAKPQFHTPKNYQLLVSTIKKVHAKKKLNKLEAFSDYLNAIRRVIEELVDKKDYVLGLELAEHLQLYPWFLELLKKTLPDSWEKKVEELIPTDLKNLLTALSISNKAKDWKMLFEKIKTTGNKDLDLKAWEAFLKAFIDLKGTKLEIAEALLWAIKSTASNHSHRLFDVFGKEGMLFSAFKDPSTSQIEEKAMLSLYENLLRECEERCTDEMAQQLLELRKGLDHCAISIHWKNADRRLAKILSFRSNLLQIAAFNIYIKLNDNQEAEQLILSLLNSDIQGGESKLIAALSTFISRLPKEKCHVASTILLAPNFKNVFERFTAKHLKPILEWHKNMEAAKATTLELTLPIYHYVIEKASFSNTTQNIIPYAYALVQCLKSTDFLFKKSNLKPLLVQSHGSLIQLLESKDEWDDIFELMTAFKRLSINLPMDKTSVAIYIKMFSILQNSKNIDIENLYTHYQWCQNFIEDKKNANHGLVCFGLINQLFTSNLDEQADSLMPQLMSFLKNEPDALLANCKSIFITTCHSILNKAANLNDPCLSTNAWNLFWNLYSKKLIEKHPQRLVREWISLIESIGEHYPASCFHILGDVNGFIDFLRSFTDANIEDFCTSLFARAVVAFVYEKDADAARQNLKVWLKAKDDLKKSNPSITTEEDLEELKTLALIIGGDLEESEKASVEFWRGISELPHTACSIMQTIRLFNLLTAGLRAKKIDYTTFRDNFKIYFNKVCKTLQVENLDSKSLGLLIQMLTLIFSFLNDDDIIQIVDEMLSCKPFQMFGVSIILDRLKTQVNLTEQHRNSLRECLNKYLEEIDQDHTVMSAWSFLDVLDSSILEADSLGDVDANLICQKLMSINYHNYRKAGLLDSEKNIKYSGKFIKLCANCLPLMTKYAEKNYREAFTCLIKLLKHDQDEKALNEFLKIIYNHLLKVDQETYDEQKKNVDYLLLKLLLTSGPTTPEQFTCVHNVIKKIFMEMINSSKPPADEEFLALLHQFAFFSYIKEAGQITGIIPQTQMGMRTHHYELRDLLIAARSKNLLKDPVRLFQYNFLIGSPNFKFEKLPPEIQDQAMRELVDIMLSQCAYYGGIEVTRVLTLNDTDHYCFSSEVYIYCWQKLFQVASNSDSNGPSLFEGDTTPTPIFDAALDHFFSDRKNISANKDSGWKTADATICKTIFHEYFNPKSRIYDSPPSPIEICKKASVFLIKAFNQHCFNGQDEVYCDLVLSLMDFVLKGLKNKIKQSKKDDVISPLIKFNSMIVPLIKLEKLPKEYSEKLTNFWLNRPGN